MGLKNYEEQINVIKQSDEQISFLESYANSLNRISIDLQSYWETNKDQQLILSAIANCVDMAADIAYDYSTFSVNSIKWLTQIDLLDKLVKAIIPGKKLKVKSINGGIVGAKKNRIKIDTAGIQRCITELSGYSKQLENIQVNTNAINSKIDELILSKWSGSSRYSLSAINKRIVKLASDNSNIVSALKEIARLYETVESNLVKATNCTLLGGKSSGEVDAEIQRKYEKYNQQVINGGWPKAKQYMPVNDADVYLKQNHVSGDCNVTAQAMLLKRKAFLEDDENWNSIDQNSIRSQITGPGATKSPKFHYDYNDGYNTYHVDVHSDNEFPQAKRKEILINELKNHEEGVVIWGSAVLGPKWPHAIILTDYDEETDTFYCADPADQYGVKRIPLSESSYRGDVTLATQYYTVSSVAKV
ncbi:MAG: hypothetical protein NC347_14025 [Clostridium sp.]|nr:hypothetical protein [Clostridium sp.]